MSFQVPFDGRLLNDVRSSADAPRGLLALFLKEREPAPPARSEFQGSRCYGPNLPVRVDVNVLR